MKSGIPFIIVPSDAVLDRKLSHAVLRTFLIICMHCNKQTGYAFPSYNTIAIEQGTDRTSVIKYVKILCEFGYLRKESNFRKNGSTSANIYHVNYTMSTPISDGMQATYSPKVLPLPDSRQDTYPLNTNRVSLTNRKNKNRYTLALWEKENGELNIEQLVVWMKENKLAPKVVKRLVAEFRNRMMAGGNEYADFISAFIMWMEQSYLSMNMERARTASKATQSVVLVEKGLSL